MEYTWMEDTPVGRLLLAGDDAGLRYLLFEKVRTPGQKSLPKPDWIENARRFRDVTRQLSEYFKGNRHKFDVQLAAEGTAFQQQVWHALTNVPFGETASYGQIAKSIGRPEASRAVGMANGRNPISIIVPCHRIIGSNGKLVGYGGGLNRKKTLLQLEGVAV